MSQHVLGQTKLPDRVSADRHLKLVPILGERNAWEGLGHLRTSEVGELLERVIRRIERHLRRRGLLRLDEDGAEPSEAVDPEANLAASAVSGQTPPAGPQWLTALRPLDRAPLAYDKPLCASLDGFTLHAATRAGALDAVGREALLRYVLRPPIAQERVEQRPDGLVRITLKKAYADGTVAVDMDPLSLLCRLATSVPAPRSTPPAMRASSARPADGGRASCPSPRRRSQRPPAYPASPNRSPAQSEVPMPTARGQSFSPAPSRSTSSPVRAATDA